MTAFPRLPIPLALHKPDLYSSLTKDIIYIFPAKCLLFKLVLLAVHVHTSQSHFNKCERDLYQT